MFTNFDDIFCEDPKAEFKLPDKYLDYISKNLPKGMKYEADEAGNCKINMCNKEFKIGGIKLAPNNDVKKILGKEYKLNDVLDYSYNSQKTIEILPIEDGYIMINDKRVSLDCIEYNPINPIKTEKGKFFLIPPKMDEKFKLELSDGTYSRKLSIHRVPNNSLNINEFISKEEEPLKIHYSYDKKKKQLNINISYNLKFAKSIQDIVESVSIYNAFVDGKGLIEKNIIDVKLDKKNVDKYDERNIIFWNKLLVLEKILGVKFKPSEKSLEEEEIFAIEEIYYSLVNKKPIKDRNKINTINGEWNFKQGEDIYSNINKPLFFRFNADYSFNVFGCSLKIPALIMVFNSRLIDVIKEDNETKLILDDEDMEHKRYTSKMYFKSIEDLQVYETENKKMIEEFKKAKSVYEVIK